MQPRPSAAPFGYWVALTSRFLTSLTFRFAITAAGRGVTDAWKAYQAAVDWPLGFLRQGPPET